MNAQKRWRLIRIGITGIFLFLLWFLFSAPGGWFYFSAGLIGSLGIAMLSYNVFIEEHEAGRRSVIPRIVPALIYMFQLVITMYAAAFRLLWALPGAGVHPRVVHFRSRLRADLSRVVLAHSITFTPGTITLELDDDHYIVHWLFADLRHSARAGDKIKGSLEEGIRRIWS
jgi:multicomponent Na+:H+ antiporter subunit E